jgi:hypothetical protein
LGVKRDRAARKGDGLTLSSRQLFAGEMMAVGFRLTASFPQDRRLSVAVRRGGQAQAAASKRSATTRSTRTCCGMLATTKLANDGHDTRALEHCLGHKNIHTARHTEFAPDRLKNFWRDQLGHLLMSI